MTNTQSKTPLLEVKHLKKYFNVKKSKLHAVDDVSASINEGTTLGVVGESGCGKSTLGRVILRLIEPTDGEIYFNGRNIRKAGKREMREIRKSMQIIFQDPYSSLNPRKSVYSLIATPLIVNKMFKNRKELKRVISLMDMVGLEKAYNTPICTN